MDPLSITASIIAVLQITNSVMSICYNYRSKVKNAPSTLRRTIDELSGLRDVLERLIGLAESAENADSSAPPRLPALEAYGKPDGPLVKCQTELAALEEKLKRTSKLKVIEQALRWPLQEGDVKKTLDNIGRFKATLSLVLTADQT